MAPAAEDTAGARRKKIQSCEMNVLLRMLIHIGLWCRSGYRRSGTLS